MYSLLILFFGIPLYFSHVFLPIGLIIGEFSSFERQKVYFFIILTLIGCIEGSIRFPGAIWSNIRKYAYIFTILLVLPIFSTIYFGNNLDIDFFIGSHEKNHGYIFYFSIVIFSLLLISSPREFLRKYLTWSMFAAILVSLIAIGERLGGILDIYGRNQISSMYSGRSSSTLGNPNYVAGYLLPFVPLFLFQIKNNTKIVYLLGLLCIIIGIFVTGSYIAIFIVGLILLWYTILCIFHGYSFRKQMIFFLCLTSIVLLLGFSTMDSEKLLSFESRFILMQESLSVMMGSPISYIIGLGPDSILTHFSLERTPLVNQYFPESMLIDSSHNLFIDIIFQYGIFVFIVVGNFLYLYRGQLRNPMILSICSLLFFLSLNVFVISHILILTLCIILLVRDPVPGSELHIK